MSLVSINGDVYIGKTKLTPTNCLVQLLSHVSTASRSAEILSIFNNLRLEGVSFVYKEGYLFDCIEEFMEDHESFLVKNLDLNDNGFFFLYGSFSEVAERALNSSDYVYVLNDLEIARVAFDNYLSFNGRGKSKFTARESNFIKKAFPGVKISNNGNDQLVEIHLPKKNTKKKTSSKKTPKKTSKKTSRRTRSR